MRNTCETCGKGYPEVQVDTYYGPMTKHHVCDKCLFAELHEAAPLRVTYAPGAQYFVDAQGRETELPSYGS